jgi:hypothetical protein
LKGNPALEQPKDKKPYAWLSDIGWKDMQKLVTLGDLYKDVIIDLKTEEDVWKKWYDETEPENTKEFPMDMTLSKFQILLLLKIFRPDRVLNAIRHFIVDFFQQNTHYV